MNPFTYVKANSSEDAIATLTQVPQAMSIAGGTNILEVNNITNTEAKTAAEQYLNMITMLESEDVAAAVVYAVSQHPRVQVNEILIRPTSEV